MFTIILILSGIDVLQKSELKQELSRRRDTQRVKQIEDERHKTRTSFEKKLEEQANKLRLVRTSKQTQTGNVALVMKNKQTRTGMKLVTTLVSTVSCSLYFIFSNLTYLRISTGELDSIHCCQLKFMSKPHTLLAWFNSNSMYRLSQKDSN